MHPFVCLQRTVQMIIHSLDCMVRGLLIMHGCTQILLNVLGLMFAESQRGLCIQDERGLENTRNRTESDQFWFVPIDSPSLDSFLTERIDLVFYVGYTVGVMWMGG